MPLYPELEPNADGMLEVGDGDRVYWEACGDPDGAPALVVHGGPGSGCTPWHRRLFDPARYRVVLFDQRGCGRSAPRASEPDVDLSTNTTQHLVADMELLRRHLDVDRWLLLAGSWGSTLALAYAEAYPDRVSAIVVWGVTTGRRTEADWLFRGGLAPLFPQQWDDLVHGLPESDREGDVVEGYSRLLQDPDPTVRDAAARAWCLWESATPDWPPTPGLASRFTDPDFALGFARLVTHYVRHDLFLEDGELLRNAGRLSGIPGVLVNGRFDLQAPLGNAWELHRAWPGSELVIVDDAGHAGDTPGIAEELIRATDRLASN
ncbi:MAG TPA: prolyl aminopeptidase [Actinomycetota bacterium]|nr:prolyl aminopeptidase [Actinomycetota bacterium]